MRTISWWIVVAALLAACGSASGGKDGGGNGGADAGTGGDTGGDTGVPAVSLPVRLKCADATNASTSAACAATPQGAARLAVLPPTVIETGDVSRGTAIRGIADADNPNAVPRAAYFEMTFDAGCNGAATWPILPRQRSTVPALASKRVDVGGACSDMPLGPRVLAVNLYDEDGVTLIDAFEVKFNLIE